jgi:hypothetical protein
MKMVSDFEPPEIKESNFHKIRHLLIEPSETIQSDILRMKTRLLSFALLLIVIVLPIIQVGLGIFFDNMILITSATIIFFLVYLLSRTRFATIAGVIMTLALASMPYLFLLVPFNRDPTRLALNLIIWPVIAALFGSQWLSARLESVFITGQTVGLLLYCNIMPGIGLLASLEPIIDQLALSLVVLIFSWSLNYYVTQLEEHKQFLEQRQRDLGSYT